MVLVAVLADVEGREAEPDRRRGAGEPQDGAVGGQLVAAGAHRVADEHEVGEQLVEAGVVAAGLVRRAVGEAVAGAQEAHPHEAELEAVGLLGVEPLHRGVGDRQRLGVALEAGAQLVGDADDAGRGRQLGEQLLDAGDDLAQARVVLQPDDLEGDGGRDVGVAVAVTAGPGAEAQRPRVRGQLDADRGERAVELGEQVGHDARGDGVQVVDGGAGLVGGLGSHDAQLVGLPQQVDELGEAALEARQLGGWAARVLDGLHGVGDAPQQVGDRAAGRLGGVRGEDRAVLQPLQHLHEQVAVEAAVLEGTADAAHRRRERTLLDGGDLLPAVQLLGDVDELEVGGEGARQHDGRLRVDPGEGGAQVVVLRLAREPAHALDELEQLGTLVPRQRLAEERAELAHRRTQGGVLLRGGDAGGERRDVGLAAVGLDQLLGGGAGLVGHGPVVSRAGFVGVSRSSIGTPAVGGRMTRRRRGAEREPGRRRPEGASTVPRPAARMAP